MTRPGSAGGAVLLAVSLLAGAAAAADEADLSPERVWRRFLDHLEETGRSDLIPPGAREELERRKDPEAAAREAPARKVDLQAQDPIRGVLFRVSRDLVNLDALLEESGGKRLEGADREKARKLVEKLRGDADPYVKAYGELHGARLDLEDGKLEEAARSLEGLVKSCEFLPKREARRLLARAYREHGDPTLAILEIQFFLEDLPAENTNDRAWARDELRRIRESKHEGPLHDSKESMRSISGLIEGLEVGEGTQAKERRVEDILDKVVKLLERKGKG